MTDELEVLQPAHESLANALLIAEWGGDGNYVPMHEQLGAFRDIARLIRDALEQLKVQGAP